MFGYQYLGIIPMYMGSTMKAHQYEQPTKNHPHVYGEYLASSICTGELAESSPCIWGVQNTVKESTLNRGIIPMYMGSTRTVNHIKQTTRNHPHVYGEYYHSCIFFNLISESSPCIWGVQAGYKTTNDRVRIIPMYMGSTRC